uniref:Uncharacterized protein n=1 Tax=Rhizophora mucronata TaxID=61149 RepID=A0A2P2N717_RHIMU
MARACNDVLSIFVVGRYSYQLSALLEPLASPYLLASQLELHF